MDTVSSAHHKVGMSLYEIGEGVTIGGAYHNMGVFL